MRVREGAYLQVFVELVTGKRFFDTPRRRVSKTTCLSADVVSVLGGEEGEGLHQDRDTIRVRWWL